MKENICNHVSEKYIFKICNELLQLNSKKEKENPTQQILD